MGCCPIHWSLNKNLPDPAVALEIVPLTHWRHSIKLHHRKPHCSLSLSEGWLTTFLWHDLPSPQDQETKPKRNTKTYTNGLITSLWATSSHSSMASFTPEVSPPPTPITVKQSLPCGALPLLARPPLAFRLLTPMVWILPTEPHESVVYHTISAGVQVILENKQKHHTLRCLILHKKSTL